jgi:DNA polymerase eta
MNISVAEPGQVSSRVIILLDLDCFYAQCESVRLSLSPSIPLCLLQWNSALAVNYPARERFGLKRGDTFEEIQEKSNGQCVALHLPVLSTADIQEKDGDEEDATVKIAYDREFNRPTDQKREIFLKEKNKMRHSGEGKASLDRYRLASARIFQVMLEALETHVGKNNFILEKASIDELYLDITEHCFKEDDDSCAWEKDGADSPELKETTLNETYVCAKEKIRMPDTHDADQRALWRGCVIARGLRQAVFECLGFTLSAGISTSKLVAKLGGSLGKPDGQAVVFPEAIPHVSLIVCLLFRRIDCKRIVHNVLLRY